MTLFKHHKIWTLTLQRYDLASKSSKWSKSTFLSVELASARELDLVASFVKTMLIEY